MSGSPNDKDVGGVGTVRRTALLERESEVGALAAFVDGIERPGNRLMLIEGPAGIGKSSLVAEARRLAAADGLRMLVGRGSLLEREFPFGVVRQLFEPELADPKERKRLLTGAAATAGALFEATPGESGGDTSFAALHGLYWLVLNLAGDEPLVLVIDDLHWVDHPSLRFVSYLLRRLEDVPIAIIAATRHNEPGADEALLAELAGDPLATSIRPGGLSEEGVRGVVEERLAAAPDATFARACHTATGGNPLLLHELLKAIQVEGAAPTAENAGIVSELGPRAASRAVLLRLSRLSPEANAVARAAAILDEGFDVPTLAALASVDESVAARATGELSQAEILRPSQPLGFVHPLIRAAIYQEIPPGERELSHAAAARLLADAGAPAERIASHLLEVPPRGDEWVAATVRRAARTSMQKGAADSAVALFRRTLAEPPPEEERTQVTLELGLVESVIDARAAIDTLRTAYEELSDPFAVGLVANALARVLLWESPPDAAAVAREAAAAMPEFHADIRLSLEAFEAATIAFGVPNEDVLRRLENHRDPAAATTLGTKMMAAAAAFFWAQGNGDRDRCAELALAALAGDKIINADHGLLPMYAIAALILADRPELDAAWDQMMRVAHRHGSMFGITTIQLWRGYTLYREGDLAESERSLRETLDSFPRYGYGRGGMQYTGAHLAAVALERGDVAGARRMLDENGDPGLIDAARYWLSNEMAVRLAEGRPEAVLEIAEEIPRRMPWVTNPTDAYWRSYKAQALDRLDRTDEALELLDEELRLARQWGAPATVGRVLRVLGTIDRENAVEHLTESVELLSQSRTRLEYAKALAELGAALRLQRKPGEAREPLYQALELATVSTATALEERVRTELGATGARPRREALSGVGSLTPSEKRVADLAADGLSNREIAQELYVTPKTVEVHLSNTYRKLDIRSRRQLSGALTA
jgi:DNA-binding CsgD family transcriptional regulator